MNVFKLISDVFDIFERNSYRDSGSYPTYQPVSTPKSKKQRPKRKKKSSQNTKQALQPLWQEPGSYDQETCNLIIRCLKKVKLDRAESAVRKLQNQYSSKSSREFARIVIVKKAFYLSKVDLKDRDPGAHPKDKAEEIFDGIETASLSDIIKLSAEMIYQIALLYGLSPRYPNWDVEVLSVFYAVLLGDIAVQYEADWLKYGISQNKSITPEIKIMVILAIGETACLFYEKMLDQDFNPFRRSGSFKKISSQAENYLKRFKSGTATKKILSKEIEKAFPIEYDKLYELLEARRWKEADKETFNLFLKILDRKKLKPCGAVQILLDSKLEPRICMSQVGYEEVVPLNNAWMESSNGHFGFAAQSQIWNQDQDLEYFYEAIGWKSDSEFKPYDELTFDLASPKGHLPAFWLRPDFPAESDNAIEVFLMIFLRTFLY